MATDTIGNVSVSLKEADGSMIQNATGWKHTLLVGAWRQDDQTTPLDDWLNAILFSGSLVAIDPPKEQAHQDALAWMVDTLGIAPADHALLHADLFSSRNTWVDPTVGVWPESRIGVRVHPSPGLWFRVWAPTGTIVGAIRDETFKSVPPFCTPTIDNRKELTSLATCCHHMTLFGGPYRPRAVEVGMRFNKVTVVDAKTPGAIRRAFGTRYLWHPPVTFKDDPDGAISGYWEADKLLPMGLYSSWYAWAKDLATGRTDTVLFLVGGYSTRLHPGYPWNFNTEHWGAGSEFSPMCVAATDIQIQRNGTWEPAPRVHFHGVMEQPNHKVYAGNNAVVISTEPVALPEVTVGQIIDPRRAA